MVSAVLFAAADTVELWRVPLVVGLVGLVIGLVILVFEAYNDD